MWKARGVFRAGQVLPLGGSFKIRVPPGRDASGKRKYHTETLHDTTPTKAEKRCTQILAQGDSGAYFEPSRATVKDFIEREWLPQKAREGVRVASSMKAYRGVVSCYIIPALGHLPLARVGPRDVQRLYNRMQDAGRSSATMKLTRAMLVMVFKQAVVWHYLRANPAEGIKLPASTKPPRVGYAFTRDEALRLIQAASEEPDDLAYIYRALDAHRTAQAARALRLAPLWRDHGPVFPRETGEPLDLRHAYPKRLRVLAARAGIAERVTPYCLRYSFATLALLAS